MSKTIVLTGPESCGKSWLAVQFSNKYKGTLIPEYSREYLARTKAAYEQEDLFKMAETHRSQLLQQAKSHLVVCDTDLLTYYIWNKVKYKEDNRQLLNWWLETLPDFYILTYPDIKWQFDPLRESPQLRQELFNLYRRELESQKLPYGIVTGNGMLRFARAEFFVLSYFSKSM